MYTKQYYVYLLTNKGNNVFYTGITDSLLARVTQHRQKHDPDSFTAKYNINKLVYYDSTSDVLEAIKREKQIKGGSRKKKIALIENINPTFKDLFETLI